MSAFALVCICVLPIRATAQDGCETGITGRLGCPARRRRTPAGIRHGIWSRMLAHQTARSNRSLRRQGSAEHAVCQTDAWGCQRGLQPMSAVRVNALVPMLMCTDVQASIGCRTSSRRCAASTGGGAGAGGRAGFLILGAAVQAAGRELGGEFLGVCARSHRARRHRGRQALPSTTVGDAAQAPHGRHTQTHRSRAGRGASPRRRAGVAAAARQRRLADAGDRGPRRRCGLLGQPVRAIAAHRLASGGGLPSRCRLRRLGWLGPGGASQGAHTFGTLPGMAGAPRYRPAVPMSLMVPPTSAVPALAWSMAWSGSRTGCIGTSARRCPPRHCLP